MNLATDLLLDAFTDGHNRNNRCYTNNHTHHGPKVPELSTAQRINTSFEMTAERGVHDGLRRVVVVRLDLGRVVDLALTAAFLRFGRDEVLVGKAFIITDT